MDDRMNELLRDNQFLEIDRHFARFMLRLSGSSDEHLMLAALWSAAVQTAEIYALISRQ